MRQQIPNTPEGVLMRLKEKICLALEIDSFKLRLLVDRFVTNTFASLPGPRTNFAKVNINNELTKNKMTIKVFFKFLRILNVKKVRFSVSITTPQNKEITVFEDINLFTSDFPDENYEH